MKKIILFTLILVAMISNTLFAADTTFSTSAISENQLEINVKSLDNIQVTGYTISGGSNIIIYYIQDDSSEKSDTITVDLGTIIRPYRIKLVGSSQGSGNEPFVDVEDSKYKDYIRHLYDIGFVEGYIQDKTYRPEDNITRAEMFTLMARFMKLEEKPENRLEFNDLSKEHWAFENAIKVIDNGLVEGYIENNMRLIGLDREITVAEALKFVNDSFEIKNNNNNNYDIRFSSHWAKTYVQNLLNQNIIWEKDDLYVDGDLNRPITRGEVAMLISRALGR